MNKLLTSTGKTARLTLALIIAISYALAGGNTQPARAASAYAIAAGALHTCALTSAGGVQCWGDNSSGQLGNGRNTGSTTPVHVSGLSNGVIAIAAGDLHTCALTSAREVQCWGYNSSGQLGDGTNNESNIPVTVNGLHSGVVAIAAGALHTCALTSTGEVQCWGSNQDGQLGSETIAGSTTPVHVSGLSNGVIAIAAGRLHTCALTSAGGVQCWGSNSNSQLGVETTEVSATPVDIKGLNSGVIAIAAGRLHTCALMSAGGVQCWGYNRYGQLGDGTINESNIPVTVNGLHSGVVAITTGGYHTCALMSAGGVQCWGRNNYGQLGTGLNKDSNNPVIVRWLSSGVVVIAAGNQHTCALMISGRVQCWGSNSNGQLGDGTYGHSNIPVTVWGLNGIVVAIAPGVHHTCALMISGRVQCWGNNSSGQLGNGTYEHSNIPVAVRGMNGIVVAIAAGDLHTCALMSAGEVQCWGSNQDGQLGSETIAGSTTPVNVKGLNSGVIAIAAGALHTCALMSAGGVQCWGSNSNSQLGVETTEVSATPMDVKGLNSRVIAIAAGWYHTCALTSAGGVLCWGGNGYGQLGDGTNNESNIPVTVNGLHSGVVAIAAGALHTCALTSVGVVQCWGRNNYGQLGNGKNTDSNKPVTVRELNSGVVAIAAGRLHTCALTSAGGVQCWGRNINGQLGNGKDMDSKTPVNVSGLSSGVFAISAGDFHTCALMSAGGVQCWGSNYYGQLGDESNIDSKIPTNVMWPTNFAVSEHDFQLSEIGEGLESGIADLYKKVSSLDFSNLDEPISSRASQTSLDSMSGVVNSIQTTVDTLDFSNLDETVSSRASQSSIDDFVLGLLPIVTITQKLVQRNLNVKVSSRASQISLDLLSEVVDAIQTKVDSLDLSNLDVTISSRASQTSLDILKNIITAIQAKVDTLDTSNLDVLVSSRASQTSVDTLDDAAGNIQTSINELHTRMDSVEQNLDVITSDLNACEVEIVLIPNGAGRHGNTFEFYIHTTQTSNRVEPESIFVWVGGEAMNPNITTIIPGVTSILVNGKWSDLKDQPLTVEATIGGQACSSIVVIQ